MEELLLYIYIKEQEKKEEDKWAEELINNLNLDY